MKEFLQSFNLLTDLDIETFIQQGKVDVLKKSEFLIKEGEVCKEVAFLKTGIFRSFFMSDKGEEITYCINFPNRFTTAYSSYITGKPSEENIQAMTDVEVLLFPKSLLENLTKSNPQWINLHRIIAEQQYIEQEKRIFALQKIDATQRYKNLITNQPEWIQQIPLQYLASYLGITQRHLSRIRKEISF